MIRIAFIGFRHVHIYSLLDSCKQSGKFEVVGLCEEDPVAREEIKKNKLVDLTHDNYLKMLDEVECDAIACGDYYGKRGSIIIEALRRGKHVLTDKPVCTRQSELDEIEKLVNANNLKIGCMLGSRFNGRYIKARELIQSGAIGEIHAVNVGGQHPLNYGSRPSWYFEEDKHGGTINDIAIHAVDFVPWITGLEFSESVAALSWNAFLKDIPHFHDAGQFIARMNNNCGFICDVSYFMPDSFAYCYELYWRTTFFGRDGIIETSAIAPKVRLAKNGDKEEELLDPEPTIKAGYIYSFYDELKGLEAKMTTADIIKATRISLKIQDAAYSESAYVKL